MVVRVNEAGVQRFRCGVIELTLGMHPEAGSTSHANTRNELVTAARAHRVETPRFAPLPNPSVGESNPFFGLDMKHYILCARCVTGCGEVQHIGAISLLGRAPE